MSTSKGYGSGVSHSFGSIGGDIPLEDRRKKMGKTGDAYYEDDMGFYRVAACSFDVALGDVYENARKMIKYIEEAVKQDVQLLVFPELSLTGYTCGDLFLRADFYKQAEFALRDVKSATKGNTVLVCVGMPIEDHGKLFNCAVYLQSGSVVGVVPKTYIPNYGEYQEKRWFVSASCRTADTIRLLGCTVPFSERLLLKGKSSDVVIGTEICEDLWVDNPPSGYLSRAGATVIVNPSASVEIVGKDTYRENLVAMQSGRCRCSYVYASSGEGESSSDMVFSGVCLVAEDGVLIGKKRDAMLISVLDIEKCVNDRRRCNSDVWEDVPDIVETDFFVSGFPVALPSNVNSTPFVPKDDVERQCRVLETVSLQARGLVQRLKSTNKTDVVVGVSGGLDSTAALIVCSEARARLKNRYGVTMKIHGVSMPYNNSKETQELAREVAEEFGAEFKEFPIGSLCEEQMKLFGHEGVFDTTYENTQARQRTALLFNYANMVDGIVIGTGDMTELALGWCTYGGDQLSNYNVNAGVPKTLIRAIVKECGRGIAEKVLGLPVSPELLPLNEDGSIQQKTEEILGDYEVHDFYLYNFLRHGFSYNKLLKLACIAFRDKDEHELKETLDIFYTRFRTQQFKRNAVADGVKVGTVSLSPRGDWRMPSDMARLF